MVTFLGINFLPFLEQCVKVNWGEILGLWRWVRQWKQCWRIGDSDSTKQIQLCLPIKKHYNHLFKFHFKK